MFLQIIQWSIISLILIFLVHYLYSFFRDTLTIPKTRDLVKRPVDEYKEMYQVIYDKNTKRNAQPEINNVNNGDTRQSSMKDELKNYLSNLNNSTSINTQETQLDFAGSSSNQFGFSL